MEFQKENFWRGLYQCKKDILCVKKHLAIENLQVRVRYEENFDSFFGYMKKINCYLFRRNIWPIL